MGNPTPETGAKHCFFAAKVAGVGKGNFQLPDTAAVSPFMRRSLRPG